MSKKMSKPLFELNLMVKIEVEVGIFFTIYRVNMKFPLREGARGVNNFVWTSNNFFWDPQKVPKMVAKYIFI